MRYPLMLALAVLAGCAPRDVAAPAAAAPDPSFHFALIGDQQYGPEQERAFLRMMGVLDETDLAFVLHVGDIKGGSTPCSDSLFEARRAQFDRARHPFVLLFGDNEWTDCHRAGGDPLERLARLRTLFATEPESLGRERIALERQPGFPENVRWRRGGVLFAGLHLVGSNNNRGRTAAMDQEYDARTAATLAWLRESFQIAEAEDLRGLLLALHANPLFERAGLPAAERQMDGFDAFRTALDTLVQAFDRPVALVHGDSHQCQVDHPLRDPAGAPRANVMRVEVFGNPHTHWIRGTVDPADAAVFRFEPVLVPGNPPADCAVD